MSEVSPPALVLSAWNIAANDQANRVGKIAEYLAAQEPGITILTELTAVRGLEKALTRELGNAAYSLDAVNTGSRYGDSIGLLLTGQSSAIEEVEAVPTQGEKMPYVMRTHLRTPLGRANLVAMRGAYVSGKGTLLSTGAAERKTQYQIAADALKNRDGISFIGGDMNSSAHAHDPVFTSNGFRRLTGSQVTWPDREGIRATTLDARVLAVPFLLLRQGVSLDAIYGDNAVESIGSSADATGISDHMYVKSVVIKAGSIDGEG